MKPTIPQVVERFAKYYQKPGNGAWGSLHNVLDDGNVKNIDVEWAIVRAWDGNDEEGAMLARILLSMSKTQRLRLPKKVREFITEKKGLENEPI